MIMETPLNNSELEKEIELLRADFQQLEALFHNFREVIEAEIESLTETIKNANQTPQAKSDGQEKT